MYKNFSSILEASFAYQKLDFHVLPCHSIDNGKCTCGKVDCENVAKHPLTQHGVKDATNDPEQLKKYFSGPYANANIALATGEPSGVIVLDFDTESCIDLWFLKYGELPLTPNVKTGRGRHYYFAFDERCKNLKNAVNFSISCDLRTTGGYALLPPSLHATGKRYEWLVSPDDAPFAHAPQWLIDMIPKHHVENVKTQTVKEQKEQRPSDRTPIVIEKARSTLDRATQYAKSCSPAVAGDGGHKVTYRIVNYLVELFGGELTDDELLEALGDWNSSCVPPWNDTELRHKIADARKKISQNKATNSKIVEVKNVEEWPTLDAPAFHGLAGEIIQRILPHSECDAASLLLTFLVSFGCAVGRKPHFLIEGTKHHANEFLAVVGKSSKARKGTSFHRIYDLFDNKTLPKLSGLSSGEGMIYAVRDGETKNENGKFLQLPGVEDKRILFYESEFAKVLKVMKRDTNTLSCVVRDAWDVGDLRILTKGNPLSATDAHLSIIAHITTDEFKNVAANSDVHNGFFNRFLWAFVRRSKLLPDGGGNINLDDLRQRITQTLAKASTIGRMERSEAAKELWRKVYAELVEEKTGLYDAATSRAEAHVLRLSMIFALLDGQATIDVQHLQAALAVWEYCDDSAQLIFEENNKQGRTQKRFVKLVQENPGIMRTELFDRFSHTMTADEKQKIVDHAKAQGKIVSIQTIVNGRQAELFYPGVENPIGGQSIDTPPPKPQEFKIAATLADLLNWKNINEGRFQRIDGNIKLSTPKNVEVPQDIEQAIVENQKLLEAFVTPEKPEPCLGRVLIDDELWNDPFMQELRDIDKPIKFNWNV